MRRPREKGRTEAWSPGTTPDGARPRQLHHIVQGHHTGQTPNGRPSRFPGYDVLREVDRWDEPTRRVVLARLQRPGALRFFTPKEAAILQPLSDLVLDQDTEPRVPIVPVIDQRMADGETDGYRFADMPSDREAWQRSLAALDEMARVRHGNGFAEIDDLQRSELITEIAEGRGSDGAGHFGDMPCERVWNLWTRYLVDAFYRHPWSWNEIGFGGPAYPRGYKSAGVNKREPWETKDEGLHWPSSLRSERVAAGDEPEFDMGPQHASQVAELQERMIDGSSALPAPHPHPPAGDKPLAHASDDSADNTAAQGPVATGTDSNDSEESE